MTLELRFDPDVPDPPRVKAVRTEYVFIDNEFARIDGVLRSRDGQRSDVVVIQTHPRRASAMSLSAYPTGRLPEFGVDTFAVNNRATNSSAGTEVVTIWEDLLLDVAAATLAMRSRGYRAVVLYGHSAGGPLMSHYQNVAENGSAVYREGAGLAGFTGFVRDGHQLSLPAADGLILQNSTTGTAHSFLLRLDGSIVDEAGPTRDPDLDLFDPANGYDPVTGAARYDDAFLRRYYRAQAQRMQRLVAFARERMQECRRGRGYFVEDELITIAGLRAEPSLVDLSLAARTREAHLRYPSRDRATVESVRSVVPRAAMRNRRFPDGGTVHTIRSFLSYRAIEADPDAYDPEAVTSPGIGARLDSTNTSTPGNLGGVTIPVLVTASTGDTQVHLPAAELAYNAAVRTPDRTLWFVDGAEHDMQPVHPRFGDTRAVHTEALVDWLAARFPVAA